MTHERDALYHEPDALNREAAPAAPQDTDPEYTDLSGYESAYGWEPKDPYKKLLDDYRKKHPEDFCRASMLETRAANECMRRDASNKRQADLFGPLWRAGELAVLVGESGVGKR